MNDSLTPKNRISTRYLILMTSFFVGANTLFRAFSYAVERGCTAPVVIKVGICLLLFSACCVGLKKRNYFGDQLQHKHLMNLHLSFVQVLLTVATLLFWVFIKLAFFGSK